MGRTHKEIPEILEKPEILENNQNKLLNITLNYKNIVFFILVASGLGLGAGSLGGYFLYNDKSDKQKLSLDKVNDSIDGLKGNPLNYLFVDGLNCIYPDYLGDLYNQNCDPNMKVILDILSVKIQNSDENDVKMLKNIDILFNLDGDTDNKRTEFLKKVFNNSGLDISFLIDNLDPNINPNLIKFLEEINPQLSLFEKGSLLIEKYNDPLNSKIIAGSVNKTAQILLGDNRVKQNGPKGEHVDIMRTTNGYIVSGLVNAINDSGFAQIDPETLEKNKKLDLIKQIKDQVKLLRELFQKKEKLKIEKGKVPDSDYDNQMSQIENDIMEYKRNFQEWIKPYLLSDPTIIDSTLFDSSIGGTFIFPILQHLFKNVKVEDMEKKFKNTEEADIELKFYKGVGFNDCVYLEIISKLIAESMFEDYSKTNKEIEFPEDSNKNNVIAYSIKYFYQELIKEFKDKEKKLENIKLKKLNVGQLEKQGKQRKLAIIGNYGKHKKTKNYKLRKK